ncbi:MAG TPA: thioesterase family protein [Planctomycetota bacterium]|nr:thioesterase family protein [Planctomycetota bacterium]
MNHPEVPPSEKLRFTARARTRWSDEDNQQVLNNAVYQTLLEEARYAYFDALGLVEDNKFPFLLAQTHLRFLRPGHGGVDVEVEIGTLRLGNSSVEQAYRIRAAKTGEVWVEARATLVLYDPATGKSRPMPEAFRAAVAAHEKL